MSMAPHPTLSPRCCTGNVNGAGRGIKGTAVELSGIASSGLLPLPARNEWGEGNPNKNGPPLPDPLLPLWGGEGEFLAASPVLFLRARALLVRRRALMAGLSVVSFGVEQAHDGQEYRQRQQAHQDDQADDHHRLHHR